MKISTLLLKLIVSIMKISTLLLELIVSEITVSHENLDPVSEIKYKNEDERYIFS